MEVRYNSLINFKVLLLVLFTFGFTQAFAQSFDLRMLRHFNSKVSPADSDVVFISNSLPVVAVTTPISLFSTGVFAHSSKLRINGGEAFVSLAVTAIVTYSLKGIVKRKRPYVEYPDMITGKMVENSYSFPSGHTSMAFATATALSLSFPKWYVIAPAYSYALLVAYSRAYLGVHYPGDILAGAIIGAGTSFLTWKLQGLLHVGIKIPVK